MTPPEQIILVDDDSRFTFISEVMIRKYAGFDKISTYLDPREALKYLYNEMLHKPCNSTIFLDINMPFLSGWEVLEELDGFPEQVKSKLSVFVLSSSIDVEDQARALRHTLVKEYITKPLNKEIIQRLLGTQVAG